jgi:hypothetical protein
MPDVIDTTATDTPPDDGGFDEVAPQQQRDDPAPAAPTPTTGVALAVPEPEPGRSTVPAVNELQTMAQLATTFAAAGLVPKDLQGRPADCLLVIMSARDLGISITDGFRLLYPIDGRVTVAPKLKLAIIRQRGLAKMWPDPSNDGEQATWHAERDGISYRQTFTKEDAATAGLLGKDNWKKYRPQMLQWRALGYLIDVVCPEVGTGLYSADELGAVTDDEGHVIDISEVEAVVPGDTRRTGGGPNGRPSGEQPADPDDLWQLQLRVHALPEAQQLTWRERKAQAVGSGVPTTALTAAQLRGARSVLAGLEREARKADPDWDADEAKRAVETMAAGTVLTWVMVQAGGGDGGEPAPTQPVAEPTEPDQEHTTEAGQRSMGDAKQLKEQITEQIKNWSVEELHAELNEAQLPTTGGTVACRKRVIGHMLQKALREAAGQ